MNPSFSLRSSKNDIFSGFWLEKNERSFPTISFVFTLTEESVEVNENIFKARKKRSQKLEISFSWFSTKRRDEISFPSTEIAERISVFLIERVSVSSGRVSLEN